MKSTRQICRGLQWLMLLWVCCTVALAQAAERRLPLWEVSSGKSVVYLFGSIHICKDSCFPLDEAVLRRFDASTTLAVELDLTQPDILQRTMKVAMLPEGQTLEQVLGEADWQALSASFKSFGIAQEALLPLQPWAAVSTLTLLAAQRQGYSAANGVDMWLLNRAASKHKKVLALETPERQAAVFATLSPTEQHDLVQDTLDQWREGRIDTQLNALFRAWQTGDADQISEISRADFQGDSTLERELLDVRNREITEKIADALRQQQKLFVVVGAAHFGGAQGIVALLRQRGFKVSQIANGDRS